MNTVAGILASGMTIVAAYLLSGMVGYLAALPGVLVILGLVIGAIGAGLIWFGSFHLFARLLDGR